MARVDSTWHRVGDWKIHTWYAAVGRTDRPPIVMVHGLGASSRYMVPAAKLLGRDYDVYAPDLPGFGRSSKPRRVLTVPALADALAAWIGAAGLHAPVLLANSLGCQIVADLAARHPSRAGALGLAGPTTDPEARSAVTQIVRAVATAPAESPSLLVLLAIDYLRCGPRRLLRTLRHALRDRIEEKLPRVTVPALVLRGSRDRIVPQRWAEEVAALLPTGRLATVSGAGHALNYSAPLELAWLTRTFLGETPQPFTPPESRPLRPFAQAHPA